ncbi:MAG: hypothetical protein KDD48_03395 [Bdellovibrionales bacterium]|nr:hypothetical protein [Bdellovibrionales bacterium]
MSKTAPPFELYFENEYINAFDGLSPSDQKRVERAIQLLAQNPRYPSLHVHKYKGTTGKYPNVGGDSIFIAYASQGKGALRIIFEFGPAPGQIALHTCGPHDKAERNFKPKK